MDLLAADIKKVYLQYFFASLGGSLALPIYGLIDMAMVGKFYGPIGVATMAIFMPIWTVLFGFGFLTGVGGAVLFSNFKGIDENSREADEVFTASVLLSTFFSLIIWFCLFSYETQILTALGAQDELLELSREYLFPIKILAPTFGYLQILCAFLRNDKSPALVTKGIFVGGVFNIIGDYVFIFVFEWGMTGAAIATAGGALISSLYMCTHFFSSQNTLKLVLPTNIIKLFIHIRNIILNGFPTFFVDVALGLLTLIFIHQILYYADEDSLAIYGIIVNITVCVRCFAFAVGHASQPILSVNFGAKKNERVVKLLKYNLITILLVTALWFFVLILKPNLFVHLFMEPTESVLAISPAIIRTYALAYLFLPFNVYCSAFTQALLMPKFSIAISLMNGIILSGIFLYILPFAFGGFSLWLATPLAELCTAIFCLYVLYYICKKGALATKSTEKVL